MEKNSEVSKPDDTELELPPGFRFHPSDEELITHYLTPKVLDNNFSAIAIGEVDLNKVEPWDLPWKAKIGEKEWYFFCMRDRKYPTGSRTNRATEAGYWKATGKDKEIFRFKKLIGMKKTLVFYTGRAPKGEKTNWVMHEYRLDGNKSIKATKNEWVISRIFKKSSGDIPSDSSLKNKKPLENLNLSIINDKAASFSSRDSNFSQLPLLLPNLSSSQNFLFSSSQFIPYLENLQHMDSSVLQEQSIHRFLIEQNNEQDDIIRQNEKVELSGDTDMSSVGNLRAYGYGDQELHVITSGPVDLDCLWNY